METVKTVTNNIFIYKNRSPCSNQAWKSVSSAETKSDLIVISIVNHAIHFTAPTLLTLLESLMKGIHIYSNTEFVRCENRGL